MVERSKLSLHRLDSETLLNILQYYVNIRKAWLGERANIDSFVILKVCPIGYLGAGKDQCRTWVGLDNIEKLTGCPLVNPSPPPTKSYAF